MGPHGPKCLFFILQPLRTQQRYFKQGHSMVRFLLGDIEDRVVDEDSDGQETKIRLLQSQIFAYAVLIPFIPSLLFQQNHPQFSPLPTSPCPREAVPCLKNKQNSHGLSQSSLQRVVPQHFWPMEGKSGHWMELSGQLFEREQT